MARPRSTHCVVCGEILSEQKRRYRAKTCSSACHRISEQQHRLHGAHPGIAAPTVGTISELLAAADLLTRGYAVFRALSPACPSDLAILKDGRLITVEVRTAYWNRANNKLIYAKRADPSHLYALVVGNKVHYEPPLES